MVINISEHHAAERYNKAEVQVFQKQLKQLTTVQYVITQKEYCIEIIPKFRYINTRKINF
jgi:hypothetical protein